jgi:N-methylhydantoinase A
LKLPMIDVHTIGAGGGSIASLDKSGILQVGPESAGADPGPAAYGKGGSKPTVTDANVVLGRIDWASPIGVSDRGALDLEAAKAAVAGLGEELGLGTEETAQAIITVVNHTMAGRTRLLSVEQGFDPRDFAFVSFGGAGPLHGAAIMREVGISRMLVPPEPGVLCATGCCSADIRHDLSQTIERPLNDLPAADLNAALDTLRKAGEARMAESGASLGETQVSHTADMCYFGQIHNLRVPIERGWEPSRLAAAFEAAYRAEFGNTMANIPIILISVQGMAAASPPGRITRQAQDVSKRPAEISTRRPIYFHGWHDTAVYRREALLPGMHFGGPAVVEQGDATTIIEPSMQVRVDGFGNLLVEAT